MVFCKSFFLILHAYLWNQSKWLGWKVVFLVVVLEYYTQASKSPKVGFFTCLDLYLGHKVLGLIVRAACSHRVPIHRAHVGRVCSNSCRRRFLLNFKHYLKTLG